MVGIFGSGDSGTRSITLFSLSSDLLQGAFNAKLAQKFAGTSAAAQSVTSTNTFGPDVIAPWDRPASSLDLPEKLGEHLSSAPLFDPNDPDIQRKGLDDNAKVLFQLWKGMKKMQALADFAATDKRADLVRPQLEKQFQRYEQEIADFLKANPIDGVTVLHGPLKTAFEASSRIPRNRSTYEGRLMFSGTDQVVPGLETDTRFNINVVKSNGTAIDIAIDLADLGSQPKTVENIVNHINSKLEAAEVTTRFRTNRDADGRVGITVERSILETVNLTPVDSAPAVYVAGTSGDGEFAKASTRKFVGFATDPVQSFDAKTEVEDGVSKASATALGPNGELYVLGTATGDVGGQVVGGEKDVFLTRYDAAGNVVWRRLVGASSSAEGFGLAVSADGKIAISGKADAPLASGSPDNGINSFVTLYDAEGEALWTRHTGPAAPDAANAVDFDAAGNVIVAGSTSGPMSGETHGGGQDAYVARLSAANGAVMEQIQFGDAGDEVATAVTVKNGVVHVAGQDGAQGFVRTYAADNLSAGPVLDVAVGDAAETTRVAAIEVDDLGRIFLAGDTSDAGFVGAGADGRLSHSGGTDAFVARLDGATGAMDFGAYLGSAGTDRARALALSGGDIYIAGDTTGDLDGNVLVGSRDAFVSRLDANGAPISTTTMSGINGQAEISGIVVDDTGDSVLTRLGLGHGDIGELGSLTVASASSVRPGNSFSIAVGDGPARRIEIDADDSIRFLAFKINRVLGNQGIAEIKKDGDTEHLKITARGNGEIVLRSGPDGFDALMGLGLSPGTIYGPKVKEDDTVFALGFGGFVDLSSQESSEKARDHMGFTMQQIEKAFEQLQSSGEDPLAERRREAALKPPPAHLQKQIASFQAALDRLTGGQG